ncbi:hypothetical protein Q2298_04720 [Rhodococcus electrodiphilus]|uniref:hypothetical protein n=1 Tax=Rhodococcus ruber TaxID=1830 RepID=UPI0026F46087|nr:hypothetical protein [Rhodococcus ruber]MDO2377649.1 hypothetical protein [Rhodococcus ruber]
MSVAAAQALFADLEQFRCFGGEHLDGFVQVPVARGNADAGVAGRGGHPDVLPASAQRQHGVTEDGEGAGTATGTAFETGRLQQSAPVLGKRARHVERGRTEDHMEPLVRGLDPVPARP